LADVRKQLPEEGSAQLLIPGETGVSYVWVSRQDIDQFRAVQARKIRRQRIGYLALSSLLSVIALTVIAQSMLLSQRNTSLEAELAQSQDRVQQLTESAGDAVSAAQAAGADELQDLNSLASFIETQDEAFSLYAEFTRPLVSLYLETLGKEFEPTGIELPDIISSVASEPRIGTPIGVNDDVSAVINRYVTHDAASQLEQIAQIKVFRENLPDLQPMVAARMTSGFGMRKHPITGQVVPHRGVDMVSDESRSVLAAGAGQVTFADYRGRYGNFVVVDHGLGVETRYAHLKQIDVAEGEFVDKGQTLGIMGDTGRTTGLHLHYEVRFAGRHVDPRSMLEVTDSVQ
ncbi:MAG: M23 family metallopeptidase, partial [Gammaproteobacteria bacterium]|nr:M23 family metallopeptidase [Gammaproteobacteria bacterium]